MVKTKKRKTRKKMKKRKVKTKTKKRKTTKKDKREKRTKRMMMKTRTLIKHCVTLLILCPIVEVKHGKETRLMESARLTKKVSTQKSKRKESQHDCQLQSIPKHRQ